MAKNLLPAILAACSLSGCVSLTDGTTQSITVNTPDVTAVACVLKNSAGTYRLVAPGRVVVRKSHSDLVVTCRKDGYEDTVRSIVSHDAAMAAKYAKAGVIVGGVLTTGVGLGVDVMTGAEYPYQDDITMPMTPKLAP